MNKPKLRSSVSVVKLEDNIVEFFLTNTRKQVRIKVANQSIIDLILELDGTLTVQEIADKYDMNNNTKEYFEKFIYYLENKSVLKESDIPPVAEYKTYRRVINFLEDYARDSDELANIWSNIRNSHVVIIGLGAVGSWISTLLVQDGVKKLTLIDNDTVDVTNLNRQFGFYENQVGMLKTDAIETRLKEFNNNINITKINSFLDENLLDTVLEKNIDLIINCADKPTVDQTSIWVGEYCMKHNIPHIIGGGYNLHLSLMGQTIIPHKSACVKCFEKGLDEANEIDTTRLKKLAIQNRKIGSFGPMCSIIASMTAMEAIKVLSKKIQPANINRRGEFNVYNMDIKYHYIDKDDECEWCGKKGRYKADRNNGC